MIVNNKRIKRLIAEECLAISDEQFFCSRLIAGHFMKIAASHTKRFDYKDRVNVRIEWEPELKYLAYTNNREIFINAAHRTVLMLPSRQARYMAVYGLFAHEMGHLLFTDFLVFEEYIKCVECGAWYPQVPELSGMEQKTNADSILEYVSLSPQNAKRYTGIAHGLLNIIEDAHIEDRMMRRYAGTMGQALAALRKYLYSIMPSVSAAMQSEKHIWESIEHITLSYAVYGKIKYGDCPMADQRVQAVFDVLDAIDEGVYAANTKKRLESVNKILIHHWPIILDYFDYCDRNSIDPQPKQYSQPGSGSAPMLRDDDCVEHDSPTDAGRKRTARFAVNNDKGENTGDEDREAVDENAEMGVQDSCNDDNSTDSSTCECHTDIPGDYFDSEVGEIDKSKVTTEEGGRIPFTETDTIESNGDTQTENDDSYFGRGYERAASDVQRILTSIAEQKVEEKRSKALNEEVKFIEFGDAHKDVGFTIHRMSDVPLELIAQYEDIASPLLRISRQMQKSMLPVIKDRKRGYKQTGLIFGRKLNPPHLYRNDGKVFYKNNLPHEQPRLVIGCVYDESGSMSYADRITYARASAIVLLDFCRALDIPVMIYGHTALHGVDLYSYSEFEAVDDKDKYRLMDMSARSNNRDGAAITYVAEKLSKRPEPMKLLIVTSDGQPADQGYIGSAAENDLQSIQKQYKRKGVDFIAAAIGSDKEVIERIYGDAYMDISDLDKLPAVFTARVKKIMSM